MAYTEFFITDILWPDFRKEHLIEAILAFQDEKDGLEKPVSN